MPACAATAQGRFQLWRGADRDKDQSYVLSVLGQADLAQALFPVGEYTKPQVRALAAARGLPTASRVDSQDLCFVADGDYRRFLADHAPEALRPGPILDRAGRQLGSHRGLPRYTIGQRSGLGVAAPQPLYVLELDQARNAVIVGTAAELGHAWLRTGPAWWVAGEPPAGPIQAEAQIRYRATPAPALVTPRTDGGAEARFASPLRDITPGQAAVFYAGERSAWAAASSLKLGSEGMSLIETLLDLLLAPALWLSLGLGLAAGMLFHLWRRGGWTRFWRDLLAGTLGFILGQLLGGWLGNEHLLIGQTQLIPGLAAAVLLLFVARLLPPGPSQR